MITFLGTFFLITDYENLWIIKDKILLLHKIIK